MITVNIRKQKSATIMITRWPSYCGTTSEDLAALQLDTAWAREGESVGRELA